MNPLRNTSDYGTSNILDKLAEHAGIELERIGEDGAEEDVDSFPKQQKRVGASSVRDRLIKIARSL